MKRVASAFLLTALLFTAAPTMAAEPMAYRYSDAFGDGWPKWIGRLDDAYYASKQRPEMSAKYLPLSLIRTGGFQKLVKEVMETPGFVTTGWPSWIGEVGGASN